MLSQFAIQLQLVMKKLTGCGFSLPAVRWQLCLYTWPAYWITWLTTQVNELCTCHPVTLSPCLSTPRQAAATVPNCVYSRANCWKYIMTSPSFYCICAEVCGLCWYWGLLVLRVGGTVGCWNCELCVCVCVCVCVCDSTLKESKTTFTARHDYGLSDHF